MKLIKYDKEFNVETIYTDINECCKKEGLHKTNLLLALTGKIKFIRNYGYCFAEEFAKRKAAAVPKNTMEEWKNNVKAINTILPLPFKARLHQEFGMSYVIFYNKNDLEKDLLITRIKENENMHTLMSNANFGTNATMIEVSDLVHFFSEERGKLLSIIF